MLGLEHHLCRLVLELLDEMDEEELRVGWDRSSSLDVIVLEHRILLVILLPGARLQRVQRVQMEEQRGARRARSPHQWRARLRRQALR